MFVPYFFYTILSNFYVFCIMGSHTINKIQQLIQLLTVACRGESTLEPQVYKRKRIQDRIIFEKSSFMQLSQNFKLCPNFLHFFSGIIQLEIQATLPLFNTQNIILETMARQVIFELLISLPTIISCIGKSINEDKVIIIRNNNCETFVVFLSDSKLTISLKFVVISTDN